MYETRVVFVETRGTFSKNREQLQFHERPLDIGSRVAKLEKGDTSDDIEPEERLVI